jgi:hypothetical protein
MYDMKEFGRHERTHAHTEGTSVLDSLPVCMLVCTTKKLKVLSVAADHHAANFQTDYPALRSRSRHNHNQSPL